MTTGGSTAPSASARLLHTPTLSSSDVIDFRLSDGTSLRVQDEQLRQIYQALWDLSDVPGAISTAAMLMHEGNQDRKSVV